MIKVLITGASGFVGSNLLNFLREKGYVVSTLTRKRNATYNYDTITPEILNNYDSLIHLAAKSHDLKKTSNEDEYFQVNTELTRQIFDNYLKSTCKQFIYFSSVKAVADNVDEKELLETHPYEPLTPYGKSKAQAEQHLLKQKLPENQQLYILRPCMIHGPGNKGNLNLLYTFISKGIPYPFGEFDNKRSFLSMNNLQYVIHHIVTNKVAPDIYNLADDESLSTNDIVTLIATSLNTKPKILSVPKTIISAIARIGNILPLPINTEKMQKLTENYCVSNEKIKAALGVKKLPLSSSDGLINTFKSFLK